ncbi:MAG: tRNA guanosine(34) transglycosylase Tgt [Dehalococcoidia bacterium]
MLDQTFKQQANCSSSRARLAELNMLHGKVQTPIFLPVGSQATVRALTPQDLEEMGVRMILCNSYHLYLRPGAEIIERAGGLHKFMAWDKPILTDSGGYQIFSLSSFRKITHDGVTFRSHIDGSEHHISPESAVSLQERLGADIIMALDVCPESTAKREHLAAAVNYTTDWAGRSFRSHKDNGQLLFGIIQGGLMPELRRLSAEQITAIDFPGYAIGGLSLGEAKSSMWEIVDCTVELMPVNKPRYLMGVGSPEDIVEGVGRGIDIFDSALPTRVARNGALYTHRGRINIKHAVFNDKLDPIEESCGCFTCRNFTAAYLHHLFKCEELLAYRLATIHNLFFMNILVSEVRQSIGKGQYPAFKDKFLSTYKVTDEDKRIEQKIRSVEAKRKKADKDF